MFLLKGVVCSKFGSVRVELPQKYLKIDPRPNSARRSRFDIVYHANGTTVTLTLIKSDLPTNYEYEYNVRVYDPKVESVPDFNSTKYNYHGIEGEFAPHETTELYIDSSVTVIHEKAFFACIDLQKVYMHDGVHNIEPSAFGFCWKLKIIRLSRSLKSIGMGAFSNCKSLECIFLPSSVENIDEKAFMECYKMRMVSFPPDLPVSNIGDNLFFNCTNFFHSFRLRHYVWTNKIFPQSTNSNDVHKAILEYYNNFPPMHKACLDSNVTAQSIRDFIRENDNENGSVGTTNSCSTTSARTRAMMIATTDCDGMTPLHIIAMNPFADSGAILACFHVNMDAAFMPDKKGKTPLEYLREYDNLVAHTSVVTALCTHWSFVEHDMM